MVERLNGLKSFFLVGEKITAKLTLKKKKKYRNKTMHLNFP